MTRRDYYRAFPVARRWYATRSVGVTGVVVVAAAVGGAILAVQGLGAN